VPPINKITSAHEFVRKLSDEALDAAKEIRVGKSSDEVHRVQIEIIVQLLQAEEERRKEKKKEITDANWKEIVEEMRAKLEEMEDKVEELEELKTNVAETEELKTKVAEMEKNHAITVARLEAIEGPMECRLWDSRERERGVS
jgi:hypothetical protein